MADIILHESVLALGTEGYFFGDNSLDVRYPHWPGYESGVSIGVGFDIGASGISAQELQTVMTTLGVPDKMIAELAKTINVKGKAAQALLEQLKLREKVRLTQQQALDIMLVIKQNTGKYVKRGFSQSYAIMHPAILEALNKISYGAPALMTGWTGQNFQGLGPLYDAQMAVITDHAKQCALFLKMMETMKNHAWVSASVKDIHGTRIPKGLGSFIAKVKETLEKGGKVTIQKGPITIEELLRPDNPTLDFAADLSNNTHSGGSSGTKLKSQLQTARDKEPTEMKALCTKVGCNVPPLSGTKLNDTSLAKCYQAFNPDKDLHLLKAQEELVKLGYYTKAGISGGMKNADGSYGNNTKKVLELYQKDQQLNVTGILDADTQKKLLKASSSNNNTPQSDNTRQTDNTQQSDNGSSDWTNRIFEYINQFQHEVEEKGSDFLGWIKGQAQDLYNEFDKDPQTDSNSFWSLVQDGVQKLTGGSTVDKQLSNESVLENIKNALKGTGSISASVGEGGRNSKADVLVIRALLTNAGYHDKAIWKDIKVQIKTMSVVDNTLIQNIKKFQKEKVSSSNPDGRIDAGSDTLKVLNGGRVTPQNNPDNKQENPTANKSLSASVGSGGSNNKADVLLIQQLLNKQGEKLVEDGDIGSKTIAAINRFQQKTFGRADGLISPNKETWNALIKGGNNTTPTEEEIVVTPTSMDAAVFPCFN